MKVYFISDTHFNHGNVIIYENRPFKNSLEMDETIINNWNNIVNKNDKVFHLGDFGFLNKEKTKEMVDRLNGKITLIIGNHDNHSNKWFYDVGFIEVYKYPIIYNQWYVLSHKPVYVSECMPYVNIHGHIHSKEVKNETKRYINCCVEKTEYKPISFKLLTKGAF